MEKRNGKSCWGCGDDYLFTSDKWTKDNLIPVRIYGCKEFICPDCHDEIPEDADAMIGGES